VSVQRVGAMADFERRRRWTRRWAAAVLAAAVIAIVSAFLAWGPIGVGPGPIGNVASSTAVTSGVSRTQPTVFLVPIDAGRSAAVIDSIVVLSDDGYPAPRIISIKADRQQNCAGAWPLTGRQNFFRVCAAGGLVSLIGRTAPASSRVDIPGLGAVTSPGIGAALTAAPPGPAGCWMATSIVIHYHVGIRHYAATHAFDLTACSSDS
jgi:hypothetical protein